MNVKIFKFETIVGFTAMAIASMAAFFSVYGIANLFSGAFVSACIMAGFIEIGKLVAASYLFRFWKKCKAFLKFYMSFAVLVLMIITSMGIFGYLSNAYQISSLDYKSKEEKIKILEDNKLVEQNNLNSIREQIDNLTKIRNIQELRQNSIITNEFLSRNFMSFRDAQEQISEQIKNTELNISIYNDKLAQTYSNITHINEQINVLKFGTSNKDIRTFKFIAEFFNTDLDTVVKWFILGLIFVFDPLAIALLLAYQSLLISSSNVQLLYGNLEKKEDFFKKNDHDKTRMLLTDADGQLSENNKEVLEQKVLKPENVSMENIKAETVPAENINADIPVNVSYSEISKSLQDTGKFTSSSRQNVNEFHIKPSKAYYESYFK